MRRWFVFVLALTLLTGDIRVLGRQEPTSSFVQPRLNVTEARTRPGWVPVLLPPAARTPTPMTSRDEWRLVWSDEFVGNHLDPEKWVSDRMPHGGTGYYDAHILPENVVVRDGNLRLIVEREQVQDKQFSTGVVHTHGTFELLYGKVEVRARHTSGAGLWPAIWLQRDVMVTGEAEGYEISILEILGNQPDRAWFHIHYWSAAQTYQNPGSSRTIAGLAGQWHTYSMEWEPTLVIWRVDGEEVYRATADRIPISQKPMWLILNNGVGGWLNSGVTSETVLPDSFQIDWVRVYQR